MPTLEVGPIRAPGALGATTPGEARAARATGATRAAAPTYRLAIVVTGLLAGDPGKPPVDHARIDAIRARIASGDYPLVPDKIADAMIAVGAVQRRDGR